MFIRHCSQLFVHIKFELPYDAKGIIMIPHFMQEESEKYNSNNVLRNTDQELEMKR
jgi:hypothetical protein